MSYHPDRNQLKHKAQEKVNPHQEADLYAHELVKASDTALVNSGQEVRVTMSSVCVPESCPRFL